MVLVLLVVKDGAIIEVVKIGGENIRVGCVEKMNSTYISLAHTYGSTILHCPC